MQARARRRALPEQRRVCGLRQAKGDQVEENGQGQRLPY
jgi:hypothetical protein